MVAALNRISDTAVAMYAISRSLWGQFVGPLRKVYTP